MKKTITNLSNEGYENKIDIYLITSLLFIFTFLWSILIIFISGEYKTGIIGLIVLIVALMLLFFIWFKIRRFIYVNNMDDNFKYNLVFNKISYIIGSFISITPFFYVGIIGFSFICGKISWLVNASFVFFFFPILAFFVKYVFLFGFGLLLIIFLFSIKNRKYKHFNFNDVIKTLIISSISVFILILLYSIIYLTSTSFSLLEIKIIGIYLTKIATTFFG